MIRHFFLDKTNSIVAGSYNNLGLNPILQIGYGNGTSRGLIHFDMSEIKRLIEDKTFADVDKLSFRLKMTNCFSVDGIPYEKDLIRGVNSKAKRAASFDLILIELPNDFDGGRGFDFESDIWVMDNGSISTDGSNWYFAKNGIPWDYESEKIDLSDASLNWAEAKRSLRGGVYPREYISEQFTKYLDDEESIVVGMQHFDFGMENLNIDITKYVLDCVNGKCNNGLCLMFAPEFELMDKDIMDYVGFFTDHTNTFFHPYVEAVYDEYIMDNRESFTVGCKNRLYLYSYENGMPVNLDILPECEINGVVYPSKQSTKGVYYALIDASEADMTECAVYYDIWSKIALNGISEDDVELEFSTHPKRRRVSVGSESAMKNMTVPSIYGINDGETLGRDEVREVTVDFRKKYTTGKKELIDSAEYRLYVKDGNREVDVIPYHTVEKAFLNNFFIIHTEDLIPSEYFIDIRVKDGREIRYFKKCLRFRIVSNVTERYE